MTNLEKAKLSLELNKVICAKEEMEVRIMERQEEIERLQENIMKQNEKILELEQKKAEL